MRVCWSCRGGVSVGEGFCPTCGVIQPVDGGGDYFRDFGLKPGFDLELDQVERAYREGQQRFHPDLFATRGAVERRYSMEHVTRLNEGYRILKNPLSRAVYLLELSGVRKGLPQNAQPTDPAFLMVVMALRESLEEVDPRRGDAGERLRVLRQRVEGFRGEVLAELSRIFGSYFRDGDREGLSMAADGVDRLRYHDRFMEELDRREEVFY